MELNDILVYDGRRYLVVGFDPMSVKPQRVYLRDLVNGNELPLTYTDLLRQADEQPVVSSGCPTSCPTTSF